MKRLVLVDRDGTINVERQYLAQPDQVEILPGAAEAIRQMREMGLIVVMTTNQSAVGQGMLDLRTLEQIHGRLVRLLAEAGAALDAIYFCPHRPEENCTCRKPAPGMALRAAREFQADLGALFVVGDKPCDIELGRQVGATTLLVRTGYGAAYPAEGCPGADFIVEDLREAALAIRRLLERMSCGG